MECEIKVLGATHHEVAEEKKCDIQSTHSGKCLHACVMNKVAFVSYYIIKIMSKNNFSILMFYK